MANKYDYKAVAIGNYAYYRFIFMQRCMPEIFEEALEKEEFWEHLTDVQKTMDAYMDNYRNIITLSEEFKRSDNQYDLLKKRMESEEQRIGNKWICVKKPCDSKEYCMWSASAQISEVV